MRSTRIVFLARTCRIGRRGLLLRKNHLPLLSTASSFPQWQVRQPIRSPHLCCFATTTGEVQKEKESKESGATKTEDNDTVSSNASNNDVLLLYESPLRHFVTRLRAVSVLSAITGSVGLPLFCALKGIGDAPTGILAFGMTFVAGSCASTAAIHYVFSPYVYSVEQIPIRQCKKKKKTTFHNETTTTTASDKPSVTKDVLLKAVSRSLILTRVETVFDPMTDVIPYKGWRPFCNFVVAKDGKKRPLFVHPEYIYNAALRKQLQLPEPPSAGDTTKSDDDNELL